MRLTFLGICFFLSGFVSAESVPDRLDSVANELDSLVVDLETSQDQATELHTRLASLEALSAEHEAALRAQDRLLSDYRTSVAALEAHDRESLSIAGALRDQLRSQHALNGWLVPLAGVAVAVAVLEGLALGVRR